MNGTNMHDDHERPSKRLRLEPEQQPSSRDEDVPAETGNAVTHGEALESKPPTQIEQERVVGITAFVSPNVPGFQCIVKQRYTDFLVNEILPDGTVLHFKDSDALGPGPKPASKTRKGDSVNGQHTTAEVEEVGTEQTGDTNSEGDLKVEEQKTSQDAENNGDLREDDREQTAATDEVPGKQKKQDILSSFPATDKATLTDMFGEETTAQILDLHISVTLHPNRKPRDHPSAKTLPINEKSKRTDAHVAIRNIFHSKLHTETAQDQPGVITIKAAPTKGPSGARAQPSAENGTGAIPKGKVGWTELGGEYLHFTLYKENKDTMEALTIMASQLKVAAKIFQVAGTKDRRGVTVQRVAIYRMHKERITKINKVAKGWWVGDFEYKKHGLELGELGGNEFLLTLRDCSFPVEGGSVGDQDLETSLNATMNSFKEGGFLNYYGLQRFGTFSTGTHAIGRKMLQGDLEGAVNSILVYSFDMLSNKQDPFSEKKIPQDDIDRADAIHLWRQGGNAHEAVRKMPRRFQAEAAIIHYLGKKAHQSGKLVQDRDWQGALMQIQRNLRLMYVHAYQSFVWNTVVGKRWEMFGNKVVAGDLVIVGEKDEVVEPVKDDVDEDGEPVFHPAEEDSAPTNNDPFTRARPLTEAEVESGKFNIFDLVLPLPGYDVEYPANAIGTFYQDFMASEAGGGMDPHKMRRSWKDVSLSGGYRKILARPGKDFEWEIRKYEDEQQQLVQTDVEKLMKARDAEADISNVVMDVEGGKSGKLAVVLKMQLGSSQYATMALRELTKGGSMNYRPDYSAR